MIYFPITKRVLFEKYGLFSISQLENKIQEAFDCCIVYESFNFRHTLFFVKNKIVLLEAKLSRNVFYFHPMIVEKCTGDFDDIFLKIQQFISLKFYNVILNEEMALTLDVHIQSGSGYLYVVQNCEKRLN